MKPSTGQQKVLYQLCLNTVLLKENNKMLRTLAKRKNSKIEPPTGWPAMPFKHIGDLTQADVICSGDEMGNVVSFVREMRYLLSLI